MIYRVTIWMCRSRKTLNSETAALYARVRGWEGECDRTNGRRDGRALRWLRNWACADGM